MQLHFNLEFYTVLWKYEYTQLISEPFFFLHNGDGLKIINRDEQDNKFVLKKCAVIHI